MSVHAADQAAAEYVTTTAVSVWSNIVAAARDVAGYTEDHFVMILAGLFLLFMAWRLLKPGR